VEDVAVCARHPVETALKFPIPIGPDVEAVSPARVDRVATLAEVVGRDIDAKGRCGGECKIVDAELEGEPQRRALGNANFNGGAVRSGGGGPWNGDIDPDALRSPARDLEGSSMAGDTEGNERVWVVARSGGRLRRSALLANPGIERLEGAEMGGRSGSQSVTITTSTSERAAEVASS
jgi:hypothetical protein